MTDELNERARVKTILAAPAAAEMPKMANFLAMETDIAAVGAVAMLAAASEDAKSLVTAATATAMPAIPPKQHAAGMGLPDAFGDAVGGTKAAADGWKRAVALVNPQARPDPSLQPDARSDWEQAVHRVNN